MKYFLHSMILAYYLIFMDTIIQGIGSGTYKKIVENPADYVFSFVFHIWMVGLFIVFSKASGSDKWLRRALVFYWIPAFFIGIAL